MREAGDVYSRNIEREHTHSLQNLQQPKLALEQTNDRTVHINF